MLENVLGRCFKLGSLDTTRRCNQEVREQSKGYLTSVTKVSKSKHYT